MQRSLQQVQADYQGMHEHTRGPKANCNVWTSNRHVPFREALWAASRHAKPDEVVALLHDRLFSKQNLKVTSCPHWRCVCKADSICDVCDVHVESFAKLLA